MRFIDLFVEAAEEIDRREVLPAAELVRYPFALFARVVEVKHRGDRIDAKAVDMVAAEPEKRVADEKAPHLVAAVVEGIAAPFAVHALARVGVLEQMGAVEVAESVLVGGKMGRHPVED